MVAGDRAVRGERGRLDDAGEPRAGDDLAGAVAAVVADAVDVDAELLGRVHRDVEVDRLAGGGRSGRREALDLAVHVVGHAGAARTGARDAGREGARAGLGDVVDVPGDHLARVVEVVLAAAQPRQGALAEGVAHGVGERARLPAADGAG